MLRAWLVKDDDVSTLRLAMMNEGYPVVCRRERLTVHQDVVAYEKGLLHGTGGNAKVLKDERHDEHPDGQHLADGGDGFEESLFLLSGLFVVRHHAGSSLAENLAD